MNYFVEPWAHHWEEEVRGWAGVGRQSSGGRGERRLELELARG